MKLSFLIVVLFALATTALHPTPEHFPVNLDGGVIHEAENAFKNVKVAVDSCPLLDDKKKEDGSVVMLSTNSYIIFTVNIPSDGIYPVTLFAQSCDQTKTLVNIQANGHPLLTAESLDLSDGATTHLLSLRFGLNTINYKIQGGSVAIDKIAVKGASPLAVRGATVTYEEVEAEGSVFQGSVIGPEHAWCTLPSEASGRQAVNINQGQYVEFTPSTSFNAIVVRFSIPNTADGVGQAAELNLDVNGQAVTVLNVTSYYSWTYGSYPFFRVPSQGNPHHFYDDVRYLFAQTYPGGTKVRVTAASSITYTIDLADFYTVPAPYSMPSGFISVTDKGADPTGEKDSAPAFQETIQAAVSAGQGVWIPQGKFHLTYRLNMQNSITVRGAGPWYSEIWGHDVGFDGQQAHNVGLYDYAVFGETNVRVDSEVSAAVGSALDSSVVQNLWIEHDKCGMWLDGPFDSLLITGVTIRNTFADGINFHMGVTNSVVEQSVIRNIGDDGLAMWPQQPDDYHGNTFKFNTISLPILANTIAIYGGNDNSATDNYCADTVVEGAGLQTGTRFGSVQLGGTTTFARNTLVRCGSPDMYNPSSKGEGAIWIYSDSGSITTGSVVFESIDIIDAYYQAVMFYQGQANNINFTNINVNGAQFMWEERTAGSIYAENVVANVTTGIWNCGVAFTITQGGGNSGWTSTVCN